MRTTLDISDDVLYAVKAEARREKKPVGEVVSNLVRRALAQGASLEAARGGSAQALASFGIHPLPRRGGVVTNELIDTLRESGLD
jgi:hypothetical protein